MLYSHRPTNLYLGDLLRIVLREQRGQLVHEPAPLHMCNAIVVAAACTPVEAVIVRQGGPEVLTVCHQAGVVRGHHYAQRKRSDSARGTAEEQEVRRCGKGA